MLVSFFASQYNGVMDQKINSNHAVVIFSGGQDSTTVLYWAKKEFAKVIALTFDYGQRHIGEIECARKICKEAEVEHQLLDLSLLNQLAPNALTRFDQPVEAGKSEGELPSTFVDGRNMLFIAFASVFAKQRGIPNLVLGVSQTDFSGYPDCRDAFIQSMNQTVQLAMDYPFVIHTPLMWIDKKETWAMADRLGILQLIQEKTLTCYNGIIGEGCGTCPACQLRSRGLQQYLADQEGAK